MVDLCGPACEKPSASETSCAEPITPSGSAIAQNHVVPRPSPQPTERRRPCRRRRKKARTPGTNIGEKTYQLLVTVLICRATSAIMMSTLTASTTREKIASSRPSLGPGGALCTPRLFSVRVDIRNLRRFCVSRPSVLDTWVDTYFLVAMILVCTGRKFRFGVINGLCKDGQRTFDSR